MDLRSPVYSWFLNLRDQLRCSLAGFATIADTIRNVMRVDEARVVSALEISKVLAASVFTAKEEAVVERSADIVHRLVRDASSPIREASAETKKCIVLLVTTFLKYICLW